MRTRSTCWPPPSSLCERRAYSSWDRGKSHSVQGQGIRALQNGFGITVTSADQLNVKLRRDKQSQSMQRHRRKVVSTSVLIINELSFRAVNRKDANLLFKVSS